jgi:hypothetical protein
MVQMRCAHVDSDWPTGMRVLAALTRFPTTYHNDNHRDHPIMIMSIRILCGLRLVQRDSQAAELVLEQLLLQQQLLAMLLRP